jgi:hypothetical protein
MPYNGFTPQFSRPGGTLSDQRYQLNAQPALVLQSICKIIPKVIIPFCVSLKYTGRKCYALLF